MILRRFGACVLFVVSLTAPNASAQVGAPRSAAAPAQPEVSEDPLGRNTPRGTVQGFLFAAGKGDHETAVRYLNTRLRGEAAVVLARQLFVVLNRRLPARLNEMSDKPEGSLSYPNEPDKDSIGTVPTDTGEIDVVLERVGLDKAGGLWLFSRETLSQIPELYAEVTSEDTQNRLIKFLLEKRIAYISLLNWIALLVGLPLLYLVAKRLNPVLSRHAGRLLRRVRRNPNLPDPELLSRPVRFLLFALIIRWALTTVTLPLLARQFWLTIAAMALIVGSVWFAIRLNATFERKIRLRLGRRNLTGALSILRFVRWAVDGLVIFIGLLIVLNYFAINATTALAGLGVGGIAVALAAQKTLENVIAGVSLISDKAIRIGDFLKVGNTMGTVTDIGLRSTRIRTLDRSMVNVPNGQIANASLENLSLRDQFWFHPILRLAYGTTVTQLRSVLAGLTNLLLQSSHVQGSSAYARFLGFGESSLNVEIFAYVHARDWPHFLKLQEQLLLEVMDLVQAAGATIALPSQITYVTAVASKGAAFDPWKPDVFSAP